MHPLRLIMNGAAGGVWNMAVDEVLLNSAAEFGQPSLRFYSWSEPTLSLGYFQQFAHRNRHAASRNCAVVRRASGGGAILHDHELTYSLALPLTDRWSLDLTEWYQTVHQVLIATLLSWSVDSSVFRGDRTAVNHQPFLCFHRRTPGDVVSHDVKIAGSAQRRGKRAVLQHGSVLLAQSRFAPELPGIRELTGVDVDRWKLARSWSTALSARLAIPWNKEACLTDEEIEKARTMGQTRFGRESWTQRR